MLARQIAIGFGIAVIFPLLVFYGVATIYQRPHLEYAFTPAFMPPNPTPEERQKFVEEQQARQKEQQKRQEAYKLAAKEYARHLVILSTPLGVAAIFIGAYLPLYAIGTGLIFGGIIAVGCGYWSYWEYLADGIRFVSLLAGFVILLFVGYYRIAGGNPGPARPGP
jgi:uncharacterized membrane protein YphA (DoxX/SURF4 family)